ncbi:MAG: signal recognition particle-docking protein FtsY [Dehalococcoidia bacterium]
MRFWRKKKDEESPVEGGVAVADPVDEPLDAVEEASPDEEAEILAATEKALERTRRGFFGRLGGIFQRADFDDDLWDELEEVLVTSDMGITTTTAILDRLKKRVKADGVKQGARVRDILKDELIAILDEPRTTPLAWAGPTPPDQAIILIIGVNGAGKTTSIGKLAHAFRRDGATVILGAADTFRAAAIDQLKVWGDRAGVRVIAHQPNSDPGSVVFDTMNAAEAARADFVIVDTAGRLHTKTNLMEELKKINRIVQRKDPTAPHETFLVLDATTGQNGLSQARSFTDAVGVTGIILAKLDGTAKGGIAFAITHELGIPVRYIGTGEKIGDLAPFNARDFVESLFA